MRWTGTQGPGPGTSCSVRTSKAGAELWLQQLWASYVKVHAQRTGMGCTPRTCLEHEPLQLTFRHCCKQRIATHAWINRMHDHLLSPLTC